MSDPVNVNNNGMGTSAKFLMGGVATLLLLGVGANAYKTVLYPEAPPPISDEKLTAMFRGAAAEIKPPTAKENADALKEALKFPTAKEIATEISKVSAPTSSDEFATKVAAALAKTSPSISPDALASKISTLLPKSGPSFSADELAAKIADLLPKSAAPPSADFSGLPKPSEAMSAEFKQQLFDAKIEQLMAPHEKKEEIRRRKLEAPYLAYVRLATSRPKNFKQDDLLEAAKKHKTYMAEIDAGIQERLDDLKANYQERFSWMLD